MAQAAESYLSELQKTAAEDGLADAEIARLLKSVQAAQFKKSESLVPETDDAFKPRSLVEIAFEAEKKRQEEAAQKAAQKAAIEKAAQEAAEQAMAEASSQDGVAGQDGGIGQDGDIGQDSGAGQGLGENPNQTDAQSLSDTASLAGGNTTFADQLQQEQAQEVAAEEARLQREAEDKALRAIADEEGYKRGFEAGLEAARSAEPTEEEKAITAMREQERQDVIARLEAVIARAASADAVDVSALAPALEQAVLKLASERAGLAIAENPEGVFQRVEALIEKVKSGANAITITLNPDDLAAVQAWRGAQNTHPNWDWRGDADFASGDIRLKLDGITVTDLLGVESVIAPAPEIDAEEVQLEKAAAEEVQLEEAASEDVQYEEVASEEVQPEEVQPEEATSEASDPEAATNEEAAEPAPEVTLKDETSE
jgi:flagellar biosynthesis/type III secretory pathway protein FliH